MAMDFSGENYKILKINYPHLAGGPKVPKTSTGARTLGVIGSQSSSYCKLLHKYLSNKYLVPRKLSKHVLHLWPSL